MCILQSSHCILFSPQCTTASCLTTPHPPLDVAVFTICYSARKLAVILNRKNLALAADCSTLWHWAYLGLWQSSSQLQMISPTLTRWRWAYLGSAMLKPAKSLIPKPQTKTNHVLHNRNRLTTDSSKKKKLMGKGRQVGAARQNSMQLWHGQRIWL